MTDADIVSPPRRPVTQLTPQQRERAEANKAAALARRSSIGYKPPPIPSFSQPVGNWSEERNLTKESDGWRSVGKSPRDELEAPRHRKLPKTVQAGSPSQVSTYVSSHGHLLPPPYSPSINLSLPVVSTAVPAESVVKMKPSAEQMLAVNAVANGKSIFLTGSAGTGKSFVLQYAIRQLRIMHDPDAVFVTASTGLAACSIGGTTIHSFAGIGLGNESKEALFDKVFMRREARARWMRCKALVIDEISMVDAALFDKLDYIGRMVRKKSRPFGGIQLVVTGDFFQLPPVNRGGSGKEFAFEASSWKECFDHQIQLSHVFRQSDGEFVWLLNELREGECSAKAMTRLNACRGNGVAMPGLIMTRLYPHKVDVGQLNEQKLKELDPIGTEYEAYDTGVNDYVKKGLDNTQTEKLLLLRLGAQVMLTKNIDPSAGLANGARGVVVGFCDAQDPGAAEFRHLAPQINPHGRWPVVRFAADRLDRIIGPDSWTIQEGGREIAKRIQVPLILAWALSVHKCQGMTLDSVETDLTKAFDFGMVYVALSRVRSLSGLNLIGFDPSKIKVHPKVVEFYKSLNVVTID
eukprot:TRINITY_DN2556_c0_g1_i1.p1 TRINITY_DN2556_c0_g1~~TRINITY_DN2556_c0_g1_i1.p1  ORF type:complete len:578 (-),score=55.00 TRINITY_DN2556_c0_g1_i1:428-2161(-)